MSLPSQYSFTRYLSAKKSVDDRALNRQVWQALSESLPKSSPENPLRVLEIGAGIGTMLERMLDCNLLKYAHYTAIDSQSENIVFARRRLVERTDYQADHKSTSADALVFVSSEQLVAVYLQPIDLFDFLPSQVGERSWDLLVANAFLDLIDLSSNLPRILSLLRDGGLFYFTINFDGLTLFEPDIDPQFDADIQILYHRTMDERLTKGGPSGDSRTGRHLFTQLVQAGAAILAAGASDWVVFPGPSGYPKDEAYFLHFIVNTMHHALLGHPELDQTRFTSWVKVRHAQIERKELVYIAHQMDFFGSYPA